MKLNRSAFILPLVLLLAALAAAPVCGQGEPEARDLFKTYAAPTPTNAANKGKPGAFIRLELLRSGQRNFVPGDTRFVAGDKVKLHFQVNFSSYVEIYNRGASGRLARLFPAAGERAQVRPLREYIVPGSADEWFEFDQTRGVEQLSFLFSEIPIAPTFRPAPSAAKRPAARYEPGITVNNNARPQSDPQQAAIDELNGRALDEGARDLKRVRVANEQYVFTEPQRLRRVLGVLIALDHQ